MKLEDILSVSGKPGLYRMVAQTRTGLLAENLDDGKRIPVTAAQQVSSLKDIAIYTYSEEVGLGEIFSSMQKYAEANELPALKSDKQTMLEFFQEILPEFDEDRVYPSHIKKVLSWYLKLEEHGLLKEITEGDSEEENSAEGTEDAQDAAENSSEEASASEE